MSRFVEVRDEETGRLLFTFDAEADIIRVRYTHRYHGTVRQVEAEVRLTDYRDTYIAGSDSRRKVP